MAFVRSLGTLTKDDVESCGVRACDLATLQLKEFLVPSSFVVTNESFEEFVLRNGLLPKIAEALSIRETQQSYGLIRELFINSVFPEQVESDLMDAYESIGLDTVAQVEELVRAPSAPFVALFLSPNHVLPHDGAEGIILNRRGRDEVLLAVKECWSCLFAPEMRRYREEAEIDNRNLNTGVIVQQMAPGTLSAEAWSATGSGTDELTVKAYLGALDARGAVAKDEYRLSREYLRVTFQSVAAQAQMFALDDEFRLGLVPIGERGREQKLTDRMAAELARLAKKAQQALDHHVRLFNDVEGETPRTLLCNRLLLTKGAIKLQAYEEEERIEDGQGDRPVDQPAPKAEVPDESDAQPPPSEVPATQPAERPPDEHSETEGIPRTGPSPQRDRKAGDDDSIFSGLPDG